MTIEIPIPEKISFNKIYAGVHWTVRNRHKNDFHFAVLSVNPKPYEGTYPIRLNFHFKLGGKQFDISNHYYLAKLVEDGLVACGVIPDDNQKYVSGITITAEKAQRGDDDVVIVTITP